MVNCKQFDIFYIYTFDLVVLLDKDFLCLKLVVFTSTGYITIPVRVCLGLTSCNTTPAKCTLPN